jgi:glycosyltransferase involved in cell wall biosynthesis
MKRIAILTNSLTGGGAERAMNLLVNELVLLPFEVCLVPINASDQDLVIPISQVFQLGRQWNRGMFSVTRAYFKFFKFAQSWKPDILILNCDLPELLGSLTPGKPKIIAIEHSTQPWGGRRALGVLVRIILKARKVKWVSVSERTKIWPFGKTPKMVIPNLIHFSEVIQTLNASVESSSSLAYVGRLSPEKRVDWVISIAQKIDKSAKIFGEGVQNEVLRILANDSDVTVKFFGHISNPWALIGKNDIVLIPSCFEGDGLVVLEAIFHRFPVLVSDIDAFRRFGLPEIHYCKNVEDFVLKLKTYAGNYHELTIPEGDRLRLLESRKPSTISKLWESMLIES